MIQERIEHKQQIKDLRDKTFTKLNKYKEKKNRTDK